MQAGTKACMEMCLDGILRHHGMMPGLKIEEADESL